MSLQDDLNAVRRNLDELTRKVEQLEKQASRQKAEGGRPAAPDSSRMVTIPDAPYDSALWTDSDDEGLGARDRRAP
ncbi:hypothetical protein HYE82_34635 [Streptomyces sp. BR123]|uniref:hypothetical protein n=1 Tax=Streptomyces sp. BR123 TaxID=2749828 RepID=UPI0015C49AE7|nr:hypothetical protein [Streptomyces sp. BR123]NXY99422.1 hypothetical protein [Streptomyces sp. BR123]